MVDVIVRNGNVCSEANASAAFALVSGSKVVVNPPFGSTTGGNTVDSTYGKKIHFYTDPANFGVFINGGTLVAFGGICPSTNCVAASDTVFYSSSHISIRRLPVHLESAPVDVTLTGTAAGTVTLPGAFEYVQYGFTNDGITNSMSLFRSGNNPGGLASNESLAIDGRKFPRVALGAVSDVDILTAPDGFLKKVMLVEQGRSIRIWNTALEDYLPGAKGQFPFPLGCPAPPLDDWSPRRVTIDPEGRLAYVLHKKSLALDCSNAPTTNNVGVPITILDLKGASGIAAANLDGNALTDDFRIPIYPQSGVPITPTIAVDSSARVVTFNGDCTAVNASSADSWLRAGYFDAGAWKSRYLIVTEAEQGFVRPCPPPHPGAPPPQCGLDTPFSVVVYDLNPSRALTCTGSAVGSTVGPNNYYLLPRAIVRIDDALNLSNPELGLEIATGSGAASDDLYVVAPVSGKLIKTEVTSLLTAGANSFNPADPQAGASYDIFYLNTITPPKPATIVDIAATHPGQSVIPSDVTIMTVGTTDFAFIPLAGLNLLQRRPLSDLQGTFSEGAINPAISGGQVYPAAIAARRENKDKVFTANFIDGSIAPIPGGSLVMNGNSVPMGSKCERMTIQPKVDSSSGLAMLVVDLTSAPAASFDSTAHQTAIANELRSLTSTIEKQKASPAAVDSQANAIGRDVTRWVIDPILALAALAELADVSSLYRQESAIAP